MFMATESADAVRISCLVGVMDQISIGRFSRPNSVTKGVTKALRTLLSKSLSCKRSELLVFVCVHLAFG